jgi:F420H(2)-dependent quinone reductase
LHPRWTVRFDRLIGRPFYPLHRRLYEWSGGRIGARSGRGPMLLLTTTGRRSGQARTSALLFMADDPGFVVVGSNGGRDQPPSWLLNLQSNPQANVQVGAETMAVTAEILVRPEADPLWDRLNAFYGGWRYYQTLTERELPAVRLIPS